jgi:hypothetical protein
MQFTIISKGTLLFQLPTCSQALEKIYSFAMWSSGAAAGAGGAIPARAGGRDGRGRARDGLGVLPARFGKMDRVGRRPATVVGGALGWRPLKL